MGLTKTEEFSKTQNDLATISKALGHPARIAILQFLIKSKSCICGDIVEELPLSQSTVSQHLKELKKRNVMQNVVQVREISPKATDKTVADFFSFCGKINKLTMKVYLSLLTFF